MEVPQSQAKEAVAHYLARGELLVGVVLLYLLNRSLLTLRAGITFTFASR